MDWIQHPLTQAVLAGLLGAAAIDYAAFRKWQSFQEARQYDWRLASWRWLQGAASGLAAWLGTTGLARLMSALVLAVTIGAGSLTVSSCGANVPPIQPLPAATESIDADVRAFAVHALGINEKAGEVLNETSKIAVSLYPSLPTSARANIDKGFLGISAKMRATNQRIRDGAIDSWPKLKAELDPILKDIQTVIDEAKAQPSFWRKVGVGLQVALTLVLAASGGGAFAGVTP